MQKTLKLACTKFLPNPIMYPIIFKKTGKKIAKMKNRKKLWNWRARLCTPVFAPQKIVNPFMYIIIVFFCIKLIYVYCFIFNMHYFYFIKTWHGIYVRQFFRRSYQWDWLRVMCVLKKWKTPCSVPVLSEKKNGKNLEKVGFFCEKIKKIEHGICSTPVFSKKLPVRLIACNVSFEKMKNPLQCASFIRKKKRKKKAKNRTRLLQYASFSTSFWEIPVTVYFAKLKSENLTSV